MNPFRSFVDLARELRTEVLHRYATDNPYTQAEAAALATRLRELAADCRVAARRMGCTGTEEVIETLLRATVDLFNSPALLRDPYSRANILDGAVPPVARLADDFDAESRWQIPQALPPAEELSERQVSVPEVPVAEVSHSDDFRSVRWYGNEYAFTTMQAACVQILWQAWQRGAPEMSQARILEDAGSASERLRDVFDKGKHGAWGTMIVPGRKGAFRLGKPA
jgi:hypothetical protein